MHKVTLTRLVCHRKYYRGSRFIPARPIAQTAVASSFAASFLNKMTVFDLVGQLRGQRVFVRVDFNNVIDETTGKIKNTMRLEAVIPTIQFLIEEGAIIILAAHAGKPQELIRDKGWTIEQVRTNLSMDKIADKLTEILRKAGKLSESESVLKLKDCIGADVSNALAQRKDGEVVLLENLRFYPEEVANDEEFSMALVQNTGAAYFINDAFASLHRTHASIEGIIKFNQGKIRAAVLGCLMYQELSQLSKVLVRPAEPFFVIIGGKKISDKIGVIKNFIARVSYLLIGGAQLYHFYRAMGLISGKNPLNETSSEESLHVQLAKEVIDLAGKKLMLPKMVIAAKAGDEEVYATFLAEQIPADFIIRDIPAEEINSLLQTLPSIGTLVWNGPLGQFEQSGFATGTNALIASLSALTGLGTITVVGGGETIKAIRLSEKQQQAPVSLSLLSSGGKAMLTLLEGKELPGIRAIFEKTK